MKETKKNGTIANRNLDTHYQTLHGAAVAHYHPLPASDSSAQLFSLDDSLFVRTLANVYPNFLTRHATNFRTENERR
jgi:hypothetical protein